MSLLQTLRLRPYARLVEERPSASARALYDKVLRANYAEAELLFAKLSDEARERAAYDYANMDQALEAATAWARRYPQSALAHILQGAAHVVRAWAVRGSSYADDVPEDAWEPFLAHLEAAQTALERAATLDTTSAEALAWLIHVGFGKSDPREQIDQWFEEGLRRHPLHWALHMKYFAVTTAKWGGSHKEMFAFASACSDKAPPGSTLHALVANAYAEYALALNTDGGKLRDMRKAVYAKAVAAALYKWLGAKPGELEDKLLRVSGVFSGFALNHFAAALYLCGAELEAKAVLVALRGEIAQLPWDWLGSSLMGASTPAFVYDRACRELGIAPNW